MTAWSDAHGTGRPGNGHAHASVMCLHLDQQGRQELARVLADLLE